MSGNFWDHRWATFQPSIIEPDNFLAKQWPSERAFLSLCIKTKLKDKHTLDIGCGNGHTSVFLARSGADITAQDISKQALKNTDSLAKINNVHVKLDNNDLEQLATAQPHSFDLVVGRFILHHLDPFEKVPGLLGKLLKPGGRAIFLENNGRNLILMLARNFLAGRFGIPKKGDGHEQPLMPSEISLLKRQFRHVEIIYPEFMFFVLLYAYLPRLFSAKCHWPATLDHFIFTHFPFCRRYGYRQIICIKHDLDF